MDFSFELVRPNNSRFHKTKSTRRALRLRNHRTAAVDLCLAALQPRQDNNYRSRSRRTGGHCHNRPCLNSGNAATHTNLLPQSKPLHLAGRSLWQLSHKFSPARALVVSHFFAAVNHQLRPHSSVGANPSFSTTIALDFIRLDASVCPTTAHSRTAA